MSPRKMMWIAGLAMIAGACNPREKVAFVQNGKIFQNFKGTIELETKISEKRTGNMAQLDSLRILLDEGRNDLQDLYNQQAEQFSRDQALLSEQYTAEIWSYINSGMKEYGEKEGFDFILGANGEGSLMFARESKDVTDQVLLYLNNKYEGKAR